MKFGAVAPQDALGAILAHSVTVGGKRLRKGALLSAADIAQLESAGLTEIVVARLEAGDIPENEAAKQLANAITDPTGRGLAVSEAFTGRVNLVAATAGVVRVDAARITAFNSVNPMITIATVPDFHLADQGAMLATIKIISFAARDADVEAARRFLDGSIEVISPKLKTARLILTEIDGVKAEKGVGAIRDRLARWGMELTQVQTCAHQIDDLSSALVAADEELILILTASATSDINDVAPASLVVSGGRVERFGMPVDPGNLLFVGDLGRIKVIGLPGCARSPALNGTDWVLGRIACGIPVSDQDIAAMGVGGLLKEIPTRPQPRNRKLK